MGEPCHGQWAGGGGIGASNPLAVDADRDATVCEMLLGCVGLGCMLYDAAGRLREPSQRQQPYNPTAPWSERVQRFDNEPWHFWDRKRKDSPEQIIAALGVLRQHQSRLKDVAPLVLPSLGLLMPLGIRFRMRLDCAIRISMWSPDLFRSNSSKPVYHAVYHICRPDFYQFQTTQKTTGHGHAKGTSQL